MPTRAVTCRLLATMALLLAGCAGGGKRFIGVHPPPSGLPRPCGAGECVIEVRVASECTAAGGVSVDAPYCVSVFSARPNEFHVHNMKRSNGDCAHHVNVQGCVPLDPWVRIQ